MNFKKLKIKNFMSIGNAEVDLSGNEGFILINAENHRKEDSAASNGAGKSSIFDALCWAITGETVRGYKDVYNRYIKEEKALCEVKVSFNFKNSDWSILRVQDRNGRKQLSLYKDGELLPSKGLRDSEDQLERHLPELTMKFLGSTVVLGQGLPQRFTNNSPAGRKAILEELSNADYMIEHVKENIQKRGQHLGSELRKVEDEIVRKEAQIRINNASLAKSKEKAYELSKFDLDEEKKNLQDLEERGKLSRENSESLEKEVKEADEQYRKILQEKNDKILEENKRVQEIIDSLQKEEKVTLETLIGDAEAKIKSLKDRKNQYQSAIIILDQQISVKKAFLQKEYCPTCGQKMQNISEEEIAKAKEDLEEAQAKRAADVEELSGCDKMIETLEDSLSTERIRVEHAFNSKISDERKLSSNIVSEIMHSYSQKLSEAEEKTRKLSVEKSLIEKNLLNLRSEYAALRERIRQHEENVAFIQDEIKRLNDEINTANESLESLGLTREKLNECIKVNTSMSNFASRDFRGILLESIISELDDILRGYAKKVYGSPLTKFYQEGNNIGISFDGKEYEGLSGGEKQKLDVLVQLSLRDLIIKTSGIEANLAVFDEVFDGLDFDGCQALLQVLVDLGIKTYLISHRKELQIPYDSVITVIKNEDGIAHLESWR